MVEKIVMDSADFAKFRDALNAFANELAGAGELEIAGAIRGASGLCSDRLGQQLYQETKPHSKESEDV